MKVCILPKPLHGDAMKCPCTIYFMLPQNFVLPSLTLVAFISHYLLGNRATGIPPLRLITSNDIARSREGDGTNPNKKNGLSFSCSIE